MQQTKSKQFDFFAMTAMRRALFFLLSIFMAAHTVGDNHVFAGDRESHFRLRVPSSLAIVGESQELTAMARPSLTTGKDARVVFALADDESGERVLTETPIRLSDNSDELSTARAEWTPDKTGEHILIARFEVKTGNDWTAIEESRQTIIASRRQWHFHYWHLRPGVKIMTECHSNQENLEYLADRGVIGQKWAFGNAAWGEITDEEDEKEERINKVVDYWSRDHPVMIDEVNQDNAEGKLSGQALVRLREKSPDQYIAVYVISINSEELTAGVRAADRVLTMAYMSAPFVRDGEFVYHRGLRYEHAIDAEVGDKALLVLSIGRGDGATIPQELRRQLHWTRYTYPEMPGIAFFGSPIKYDLKSDQQLHEFYINPVLRVEPLTDGRIKVTNIGGDHAPATQIKVLAGAGEQRKVEVDIPPLEVKEEYTFGLESAGAGQSPRPVELSPERQQKADLEKEVKPISEYRPGLYVLGPPRLWNKEPAHLRPGALSAWPIPGPVIASGRNLLDHKPSADEPEDKDDNETDTKSSPLYYEMTDTEGRSFQLSYSLHPINIGDGGEIVVRLEDQESESRLELAMRNNGQMHGRGSPGWSLLRIRNEKGLEPKEYLPLGLEEGIDYRFKIHYNSSGYVRAAILDEHGKKLWDTGEVPTYGDMSFDRISFDADSQVEWQPDEKAMELEGTSWQGSFAGRLTGFELDIYDR